MLSIERYNLVVSYCEGMALDAVWHYVQQDRDQFAERKKLFLWLLRRMLDENKIVAAKNGIRLHLSGSEISRLFDLAFPADKDGLKDGLWFFSSDCPAGIGWVGPGDFIDWV
jgi:hypothetical protein